MFDEVVSNTVVRVSIGGKRLLTVADEYSPYAYQYRVRAIDLIRPSWCAFI